jgi:phosphate transport system substrate-binding protein
MKKVFGFLLAFFCSNVFAQFTGAGATFPEPIYSKWAAEYAKVTNVKINYSAIGSGGGIKQTEAKTIDFGATDDPVDEQKLKEMGVYQFPAVIGGVVPVFNIKGVDNLVLTGKVLGDIYVGKIIKWNDPAIIKLNPKAKLPNIHISLVVRSDASGTTAVYTDYLTKVSEEFKTQIGEGKSVKWKGTFLAGKGNAGVANFVKTVDNSLGYVEYAFVKQGGLNFISIETNKKIATPSAQSFAEAAKNAKWDVPGMAVNLNNQPSGWPITSATFILIYEKNEKTKDIVKFFDWAFKNGDKMASDIDYVPLPNAVKDKIRSDWKKLGLQ